MMNNTQLQQQRLQPWVRTGLNYAGVYAAASLAMLYCWCGKTASSRQIISTILGSIGTALFQAWEERHDYLKSIAESDNVHKAVIDHCKQNGIADPLAFGLEHKLFVVSGPVDNQSIWIPSQSPVHSASFPGL